MVAVRLEDVEKVYTSGRVRCVALRGVSLKIDKGSSVAIVGPSGSGKTTLLNLVGCLDRPTQGRVFLEEEDVTELSQRELERLRRERIGFIFQTFNLIQALTVYENIEFPLLFSGIDPRLRREKVERMLECLGLQSVADHRAMDISGGQQQRTAIGRALVKEPLVVLADEPTGNLDAETSLEILELMRSLNRERGVTFIFVTHNQIVVDYTDTTFRLVNGRIEDERE